MDMLRTVASITVVLPAAVVGQNIDLTRKFSRGESIGTNNNPNGNYSH